jgi:hypothetical protein
VAAALPLLVTGLGYALAMRSDTAAGTEQHRWLIDLMLMEQFLLATTLAMLIFGWFYWERLILPAGSELVRGALVILLAALMMSITVSIFTLYGATPYKVSENSLLVFVLLWLVTYSGLVLNWNSGMFWFQFLVRWIVSVAVFGLSVSYAGARWDIRLWPGNVSVIEAGALYFLVLGGIELAGFYQRWLPAFARRAANGFRKTG